MRKIEVREDRRGKHLKRHIFKNVRCKKVNHSCLARNDNVTLQKPRSNLLVYLIEITNMAMSLLLVTWGTSQLLSLQVTSFLVGPLNHCSLKLLESCVMELLFPCLNSHWLPKCLVQSPAQSRQSVTIFGRKRSIESVL